jgi:hypothetical protein
VKIGIRKAVVVGAHEITFIRAIFLKVKKALVKYVNYVIDYTIGNSC